MVTGYMGTIHDIDEQRRADLARVIMQILDEWGVSPEQRVELLGLPDNTSAETLLLYRQGMPIPDTAGVMRRISHVLTIRNALRTTHPHNAAMADFWITTPHLYFNDESPLAVMLARGEDGMRQIVEHLNGTGEWG